MTSLLMYAVDIPPAKFIEELDKMASEWFQLGTNLGISVENLRRIESRGGLNLFMINMMEMWLKTGEATWEQLEHALTVVDNKKLAKKVEELKEEG